MITKSDIHAFFNAMKLKRPKLSQTEFATEIGVDQPTVSRWLSGANDPENKSQDKIRQAMQKHGFTPGDALTAPSAIAAPSFRAPPAFFDHENKMPVYSSAQGGEGVLVLDSDPIDWVERPQTLAHVKKAFAIVISGDSMVPAYKPNDRAWVNPQRKPITGQDCVIYQNNEELGEERLLIKEFVRETDKEYIVRQHNPPKEMKLLKSQWHRIYLVTGRFNRDL